MVVVDATFERNFVSSSVFWSDNFFPGGGMSVFGEAIVTIGSSRFYGNGASRGGGLIIRGNNTVTVDGCVFEENLAMVAGGGMFISVSGVDGRREVIRK